jgi:hypothetical protein
MSRINPADPTQASCDRCGRWYNRKVLEATGTGDLCMACAAELGLAIESFPEQRAVLIQLAVVNREIDEYNVLVDVRDAAVAKAKADEAAEEEKAAKASKAEPAAPPKNPMTAGPLFGTKLEKFGGPEPPAPETPTQAAPVKPAPAPVSAKAPSA